LNEALIDADTAAPVRSAAATDDVVLTVNTQTVDYRSPVPAVHACSAVEMEMEAGAGVPLSVRCLARLWHELSTQTLQLISDSTVQDEVDAAELADGRLHDDCDVGQGRRPAVYSTCAPRGNLFGRAAAAAAAAANRCGGSDDGRQACGVGVAAHAVCEL